MNTSAQHDAHWDEGIGKNSVAKTARLVSLDYIRGIAVMGILAANIVAFGQPFIAYMWPEAFLTPHDATSDYLWAAQFVAVDGKMRGLFTLLFGAGMMLFLEKAWARGSGRRLQARRLLWLLMFGLVHFYLIWRGDILILYAIAGFAALAFVKMSAKRQMVLGLLGYLAGAVLYALFMVLPYMIAETDFGENAAFAETRAEMVRETQREIDDAATETSIITQGNYFEFVNHTITAHGTDPLFTLFLFGFETLPLMLIGMALYNWGLFSGRWNPTRMQIWGWTGVIGGSLLTVPIAIWALADGLTYWGTLAAFVGISPLPRLPVILGLVTLLALYGTHATGWLGQRVSAAGRMAFSNYLGTSLVMMLVFHGWAGGLYGALTRPELYLVVLAAWAIMLAWSKPWLERFQYGPLEWLWRCLTYGALLPVKRET
ncbi:DUF418 domain-containing protein [Pontixanthobacter sp.]|uniref:DUF418 domain-containing protein n=1 Tax=Pontixanthobacter sp. TaxID=2792078 RepID=UPI003C7B34A7